MKTRDEFIEIVSSDYWKHVHNQSFIPFEAKVSRVNFCSDLYDEIIHRKYSPHPPRAHIIANKHNLVARIVPALTLKDNCVYYYCIKCMENELAVNHVDGTFGGFRLGGQIRKQEEKDFAEVSEIPVSMSPFSFNPFAWIKEWKDFQKKAFVYSRNKDYKYFIIFDIANFYDTINLSLLEKRIRHSAGISVNDEIDLLFFFLRYWDKKLHSYFPKTVGIPQDEVGDCSRILANFYLQEYDRAIFNYCSKSGSQYLRYADDQIIMSSNQDIAEDILFYASKALRTIGLNTNSSKVHQLENRGKFSHYWAFDIFTCLEDKENVASIEEGIKLYLEREKESFKWDSALRRLLNCSIEKVDFSLRAKIFSECFDDRFLSNADDRIILRLYNLLPAAEKSNFISKLGQLAEKTLFNIYHYRLLRAKRKGLPINFEDKLKERICSLGF